MFIAAIFTVAKTWRQLKCPSTDDWIKKMHTYTMVHYSAIRKDEILPFAKTGMDLANIMVKTRTTRKLNCMGVQQQRC